VPRECRRLPPPARQTGGPGRFIDGERRPTIAGSDPSGGRRLQADLKTFTSLGVVGPASVVTALTAQDTRPVCGPRWPVDPGFVGAQLDAVLTPRRRPPSKTGMLARAAVIETIVDRLRTRPVPHPGGRSRLVATMATPLLEPAAVTRPPRPAAPLATLVTRTCGSRRADRPAGDDLDDMRVAGRAPWSRSAARAALVTGGHLTGAAVDVLFDGPTSTKIAANGWGRAPPTARGVPLGCDHRLPGSRARAAAGRRRRQALGHPRVETDAPIGPRRPAAQPPARPED